MEIIAAFSWIEHGFLLEVLLWFGAGLLSWYCCAGGFVGALCRGSSSSTSSHCSVTLFADLIVQGFDFVELFLEKGPLFFDGRQFILCRHPLPEVVLQGLGVDLVYLLNSPLRLSLLAQFGREVSQLFVEIGKEGAIWVGRVLYVVHALEVLAELRPIHFGHVGSKGRVGDLAVGLLVSNEALNLLLLFEERRELHILALVREQLFQSFLEAEDLVLLVVGEVDLGCVVAT